MSQIRVLVIGLDGATFDVLNPLIESGHMPCLSSLMKSGAYGPLRSTILPGTPMAWSSFATGKNPGKHRIFEFMKRLPGTYDMVPTNASDREGPDLWTIISRYGRKVGVLNVPYTFPVRPVNGFMVSGMMTPHGGAEYTYPPSLAHELDEYLGGYQLHPKETYSDLNITKFLRDLYQITKHRTKAALYLMRNKPWDFFMVVFNGTDRIQHGLFKFIDPSHPLYSPKKAKIWAPQVANYFAEVDRCCARLIDAAGDDTIVMVVSDHGMRPLSGYVHLNNYLIRRALLKLKRNWSTRIKLFLFNVGFTPENLYRLLLLLRIQKLRQKISRGRARGLIERIFLSFKDVDWTRTKAYQFIGGHIYINLRGREPHGIISPGEEYERLRRILISELKQLSDPSNGNHLIEHVWLREEIYSGEYVNEAPDILFLPATPYSRFTEYEFASNRLVSLPPGISGDHSMNGIFILSGPGIRQGIRINNARIIDCAPTILYALDLGVPSDMDGRVLEEAFDANLLASRPPKIVPAFRPTQTFRVRLSREDEEKIKARLRDLGYLG